MKEDIKTDQATTDVNLKEMKEEMTARLKAMLQNQEKKEARIDTNEKLEVL
jgi:hypothetical protein